MDKKRLHRRQFCALMGLLLGLVWIWQSRAQSQAITGQAIAAPTIGFSAPDFNLETSTGGMVKLSDLLGRPVIINVWASWCPPCRAEMPALEKVSQEYQTTGLVLLGINATQQDSRANVLAFIQEKHLTFPILYDEDGRVYQVYQVRALPTTFFIRPDGTILDIAVGGPLSEAFLRIRIEQLLEALSGGV